MVRIARFWVCVGLFACAVSGSERVRAQEEPTHTLHVYADTIQLPVLVLGADKEPMKRIAADRFSVSLDSGPWFRATHVREEGEDPISLGILLDVSGDEGALMPKMAEALAALAPDSLGPQDTVSIYALNCTLVRSELNMPVNAATLRDGVDHALASWREAKLQKKEKRCARRTNLWDSAWYISGELQKMSGRRVLLVVTDGIDRGSVRSWNQVRLFAQAGGVAMFGMSGHSGFGIIDSRMSLEAENEFRLMCEASGGMVMPSGVSVLDDTLKRFIELVRGRYIVEFPRPYNGTSGEHIMVVKIDRGQSYFVRPAGISVPVQDAATRADPTTVPEDPTKTPTMGNRKIKAPR
jgi:hypothetical protein